MHPRIAQLGERALGGEAIGPEDARWLFDLEGQEVLDLLYWANRVRAKFKGDVVEFCAILSAKQGACPEDCRFCSQSAHHAANVPSHPLMAVDEMLAAAGQCDPERTVSFGIVTSGAELETEAEWDRVLATVREISGRGRVGVCGSLGFLTPERAKQLHDAGMRRYNHNLETSRSFFPRVCTTHSYDDRVATVRAAKAAGMQVCGGGIFGMGESINDRVEFAMALRDLEVDAIPLNFLNPIPGTPLADATPLKPMDILKIVGVFRLLFPDRTIKLCGGREAGLRDLQSWMFYAGANGAIIGNYLTTAGRSAEDDLRMVEDLGLEAAGASPS